jgi:transcriptional regulator with XRE-family HTH domain
MTQADFNESVSGEIRAQLGRTRMTQQQLARRLGWAPSQLSRRLSGIVPFSTAEIDRIADALGIPRDELTSPRALAS